VSLDSGAIGLVRGFGESTLAGTAAAALNVDWRFPLLRIERGLGPWPLFLNVLHGAIFVDTGSAGRSLGSLGTPIWSAGAECSALVTVGFGFRISVTGGVAYTHQSARADPGQVSAFARTGFAF
jgi:hemolysin activation/secretion protein